MEWCVTIKQEEVGLECGTVVGHWPSTCEALGTIPKIPKTETKQKEKKGNELRYHTISKARC
jgi:hypothetical protein